MMKFPKHIFAFTAVIKIMYRTTQIKEVFIGFYGKRELENLQEYMSFLLRSTGLLENHTWLWEHRSKPPSRKKKSFLLRAALLSEFYMDDVLTGAQSLSDAKELQCQLNEILKSACMTLHKWGSCEFDIGENACPVIKKIWR